MGSSRATDEKALPADMKAEDDEDIESAIWKMISDIEAQIATAASTARNVAQSMVSVATAPGNNLFIRHPGAVMQLSMLKQTYDSLSREYNPTEAVRTQKALRKTFLKQVQANLKLITTEKIHEIDFKEINFAAPDAKLTFLSEHYAQTNTEHWNVSLRQYLIECLAMMSAISFAYPAFKEARNDLDDFRRMEQEVLFILILSLSVGAPYLFTKYGLNYINSAFDMLHDVLSRRPVNSMMFQLHKKTTAAMVGFINLVQAAMWYTETSKNHKVNVIWQMAALLGVCAASGEGLYHFIRTGYKNWTSDARARFLLEVEDLVNELSNKSNSALNAFIENMPGPLRDRFLTPPANVPAAVVAVAEQVPSQTRAVNPRRSMCTWISSFFYRSAASDRNNETNQATYAASLRKAK